MPCLPDFKAADSTSSSGSIDSAFAASLGLPPEACPTHAMVITAWIISLLASLLASILLIRFRKRWVAAFNLAITNRITRRFASRLASFGILTHVS